MKQLDDVCLRYKGTQECRYLARDDQNPGVFVCLKQVAAKKAIIDTQVKKFVEKAKANGQDPTVMGRALGDNCKGYPNFRRLVQGYDQP